VFTVIWLQPNPSFWHLVMCLFWSSGVVQFHELVLSYAQFSLM